MTLANSRLGPVWWSKADPEFQLQLFQEALAQLPEDQRRAAELHYLKGKGIFVIAQDLGMNTGDFCKLLAAAERSIKAAIEPRREEYEQRKAQLKKGELTADSQEASLPPKKDDPQSVPLSWAEMFQQYVSFRYEMHPLQRLLLVGLDKGTA